MRTRRDVGRWGLGWCAGLLCAGRAGGAAARPSSAAPAMLLAREAPPGIDPAGYLVSEKYDGIRAQWDGTRLRFRGGGEVAAPAWFRAGLPAEPLDGELWLGRGRFEALAAVVRDGQPDDVAWRGVRYMVFELPGAAGPYAGRAARLQALAERAAVPWLAAAPQWRVEGAEALAARLAALVREGGEGLMLHRADAPYATGRSDALLKLKPLSDAEAVVIAHLPGQGRHAGRLGALQVQTPEGLKFAIGTGFSDAVRAAPPAIGSTITYTYRGRTGRGLPRFASFLRVHEPAPSRQEGPAIRYVARHG